jgi:arsenate reductase
MNTEYITQTMYLGYRIMEKSNILFLCVGNSARSQMAEGLLRYHAGDYYNVYSAGLEPKGINPFTTRVMEEQGIPMTRQYSKSMTEYIGKLDFAYIITVCSDAVDQCPFFPGAGIRLHWDLDDPARVTGTDDEKLAKFRQIRDQLETRILMWLAEQGVQAAA